MKKFSVAFCILFAALLAVSPALAGDLAATLASGKVFTRWSDAIGSAALTPGQPVLLTPVAFEKGVALFQLKGLETGEVDHVLIVRGANPLRNQEEGGLANLSAAARGSQTYLATAPEVGTANHQRCIVRAWKDINFGNLRVTTDLDFNSFGAIGENDNFTSVQTTCNGAIWWEHTNWGGSGLFQPANNSIANLSSFNFNDKISAMEHVLP